VIGSGTSRAEILLTEPAARLGRSSLVATWRSGLGLSMRKTSPVRLLARIGTVRKRAKTSCGETHHGTGEHAAQCLPAGQPGLRQSLHQGIEVLAVHGPSLLRDPPRIGSDRTRRMGGRLRSAHHRPDERGVNRDEHQITHGRGPPGALRLLIRRTERPGVLVADTERARCGYRSLIRKGDGVSGSSRHVLVHHMLLLHGVIAVASAVFGNTTISINRY
jgi:hypothetical protein